MMRFQSSLRHALPVLLLVSGGLPGCSQPVYIATLNVGDGSAIAGQAQGYSYTVKDEKGEIRTAEATLDSFEFTPSGDTSEGPRTLTFTAAVVHNVKAHFSIDGQQIVAEDFVDVKPGPPSQVFLTVTSPARAGDSVPINPVLADPYGNPAAPPGSFKIEATPDEQISQGNGGATLTFLKAGEYLIKATETQTGFSASASISIVPAEAQSARLVLSQNRIAPNQSVTATLIGIDGYNNEETLEATFQASPAAGTQISATSIKFASEGVFTVTGTAGSVSASSTVTVDGTPPILTVTAPLRATYQQTAPVMVTGTITDNVAGLDHLSINGTATEISGDNFSMAFDPSPGTNVLSLEAVDLNGNVSTGVQSFLWAPSWTPLGTPSQGGLYGRLNQPSLDILADILTTSFSSQELEDEVLAENPLYSYDDGKLSTTVTIQDLGYDDPAIGLLTPHKDSSTGYLTIEVIFENLHTELEAHGSAFGAPYQETCKLSALEGVAIGDAYASVSNGKSSVNLKNVAVLFNGFSLKCDSNVLNSLTNYIKAALQDELAKYIEDEVPSLLEEELEYLNYHETLDIPIGDTTATISIDTVLESLSFDDAGGTIGETTTLNTLTLDTSIYPGNPGAPRVGAADLSYGSTPGYLLSASNDALNTLLHALWSSGVLQYRYTVKTDSGQTLTADIRMPLPPVVQPSASPGFVLDGSAGDIVLDLYTDPNSSTPAYELAVSLIMPATVEAGEGGVTISVKFGDPEIYYQVLSAPARGLDASTLGLVVNELVELLLTEVESEAENVALPEFEGYQLTITGLDVRGSGWGWLTVAGNLK